MAIIKPLGMPSKYEAGLGSQIGKMAAKGLLIDLPTAAIKTVASIPFPEKDEDSDEDKLLKKAIQKILSRQALRASGGGASAPVTLPAVPNLGLTFSDGTPV